MTNLRRLQARQAIDYAGRVTRTTSWVCARTRWGGVHILLVEDDESVKDATVALLASEGYQVTVAMHGAEALERLRRGGPPSLILLDYQMPVMDGLQFRARQAKDPQFARVPVIMCSAEREPPDLSWPLAVNDWLQKPVDPSTLIDTVRKYVIPA